jgi:DNA-binding NarL/FixJ family response regulator
MTTVLVVDDQPVVRLGFSAVLAAQDDLEVVGDASDGAEAVEAARRLRPDVVVMDVRMPVMDGIEATRRITAIDDAPRVLVLTTFDLDEYVYDALRAGASGFLLKDAPAERLADAVRVVAAGEALLAPSVTRRLIAELAARRSLHPRLPSPYSRRGSVKCSSSSRRDCPTPRSPTGSSLPSRRSSRT